MCCSLLPGASFGHQSPCYDCPLSHMDRLFSSDRSHVKSFSSTTIIVSCNLKLRHTPSSYTPVSVTRRVNLLTRLEMNISLSVPFGDTLCHSYNFHVCCCDFTFRSLLQAEQDGKELEIERPLNIFIFCMLVKLTVLSLHQLVGQEMKKKAKPTRPVGGPGATARDESSLPSPQKGQQTPPSAIPMGESYSSQFGIKMISCC